MSAKQYPTLLEMGVEDVDDIESYSTRTEGDVDILKIYYHRHHGDWLVKSKKFKFKRTFKTVPDEGIVPYRASSEASKYYLKAITELDQLVAVEKETKNKKERLLEELEHLDKVVSRKIEDLRHQINEL